MSLFIAGVPGALVIVAAAARRIHQDSMARALKIIRV
jgi:hypothetical protein